jgi:Flp pilus assembly protein TadD
VYASSGQIADGEELTVLAHLGADAAAPKTLRVTGRLGDAAWRLEQPIGDPRRDARYLPRLFAEARVDSLLRDEDPAHATANQKEITALGMAQFLITPYTSLLVLENDKMYAQYKVNRGSPGGWAWYDAPKTIKVVSEPYDKLSVDGDPDPSLVILRQPIDPFPNMELAPGGPTTGSDATGWAGDDWSLNKSSLIKLAKSTGADDEDRRSGGDTGGGLHVVTTNAMQQSAIDHASWATTTGPMPVPIGGGNIGTMRIDSGPVDSTITLGTQGVGMGGGGGHFASADGKGSFHARKSVTRNPMYKSNNAWDRSYDYYGYNYNYYNYYNQYPTAFVSSSDARLDDLTEFVPAIFGDLADVEREALLRDTAGHAPGSISQEALSFIDDARRRRTAERYTFADGEIMTIDASNRFVAERVNPSKLVERVTYDGHDLVNAYPELGLAVKRRIGSTEPAMLLQWAPWILPSPAQLSRWYDVALKDRTLRLTIPGTKDAKAREIDVDADGHVTALRTIDGAKTLSEERFEWSDGQLVVIDGHGTRTTLTRDSRAETFSPSELDALTVVSLPLAQPSVWHDKLAALTIGGAAWRDAQHQLLASLASLGDEQGLLAAEAAFVKDNGAPLTRGEVALTSRVGRYLDDKQRTALVAGLTKDDPVRAYLRAIPRYTASAWDEVAQAHKGTLVGMLASYRGLLRTIESSYDYYSDYGARGPSRKRIEAFAHDYGYPQFRYLAVWQYARYFQWQDPKGTVALWDSLAELPEWRTLARIGAAQAFYAAGKYDDAAERYERAFHEAQEAGETPIVDYTMHSAFQASPRGEAGWRLFWTRYRAQVIKSGDPRALAAYLRSTMVTGETADLGAAIGAFRGKKIDDRDTALELADLLGALGRTDDAWTIVRPLVDDRDDADGELLEKASFIAEEEGRVLAAARYEERAMKLRETEAIPLETLRDEYRRLFSLRARLAQSLDSGADAEASVAAALAVAAKWRRDDPDNSEIDTTAARLLYALGRSDDAWRQLATTIERHPAEGQAYADVAGALENEGNLDQADRVWSRAVRVEPTNPTWLLHRAENLTALGDERQARTLLTTITAGKWQDRFSAIVYQAKDELAESKR